MTVAHTLTVVKPSMLSLALAMAFKDTPPPVLVAFQDAYGRTRYEVLTS